MTTNFDQIKTKTIGADLSQVVDKITRQYEDFPLAFQKEAIQNAWDARLDRKLAMNWTVRLDYRLLGNYIIVEDFGTKGMDQSGWEAFTALWKPKKEYSDAGGQGQGKFVLMGASKEHILIVESKSIGLPYCCRFLQNDQKDNQERKFIVNELIQNACLLAHQGTKVWVCDVRKEFLGVIRKKEFSQQIASTWWQILQGPFKSKIYFLGDQITLPELPSVEKQKKVLENQQIATFGKIKRLILQLYVRDLPEYFRGVKVQRAQMMVTRVPFEVYDKEYKNRLGGYILFDEKLESGLKKIEMPNHCSFTFESPWKEIKKLVEKEMEKFIEEIIPKKQKKQPINDRFHDEIISKANQIINEYMPELIGTTDGPIVPPIEPKLPPKLRIDNLTVSKREEVKYNEPVQRRCTIKNETNSLKKVTLEIILKHEGKKLDSEKYVFKIKSGERKTLLLSEIKLDESYKKGQYTIRGVLNEEVREIHTRATSFYLEAKRPHIKSGLINKFMIQTIPDTTVRNTQIKNGSLTIFDLHPDWENIIDTFEYHPKIRIRQVKFYVLKIIMDEAIREYLKMYLREENQLDEDRLNEILNLRDKIYYEIYT